MKSIVCDLLNQLDLQTCFQKNWSDLFENFLKKNILERVCVEPKCDIMQQKSDNYVEGNGIGPPSGYNNIDHQLQNQGNFF